MSAVTLPVSMLSTVSLCILRLAVSVEWSIVYTQTVDHLISDGYKYVHEGD